MTHTWPPQVRAYFKDALLGLVVFIAVSWMITADQASERPPDPIAYFWAFGLGALLMVRRTYPLIVLWVTVLTLVAYYMLGYPAVGLSIPTAAALLSAAEFRAARWPVFAAVALLTVSYAVRVLQGQDVGIILGYELAGELGLMTAAIALGISFRLRRELQHNTAQLVESMTREERSRANAIVATERADIARDLHDSLGHQVTIISMYSEIARETVEHDPQAAHKALEVVSATGSEMLSELRQTVRALREHHPVAEVTTLASLERQIIAPLPLDVHTEIDPQLVDLSIPSSVQTTIYRVVQESLTNVMRHSLATSATVDIHQDGGLVAIIVADPGPARDDTESLGAGAGIAGMAERVKLLGGTFAARPDTDGFIVEATLPMNRELTS